MPITHPVRFVSYQDPQVQARYPNGLHSIVALDALVQEALITMLAPAIKLNSRIFELSAHLASLGPAAAAAPASPPAVILVSARGGAARVGHRLGHVPPLPPCNRRTKQKPAVDLQSLKSQQLTCSPCGRALSWLA